LAIQSDQIFVKPLDGLQEGLLLGELLNPLACVASDRETMRNSTVEIDLVWLLGLNEDNLGLVALLSWKDLISLGCGDGKGTLDSL
jgi:hypothetical protein